MIIGIDASNLRAGGGVTHLVELLRVANPGEHDFDKIVVWASKATHAQLVDRPWLVKRTDPVLEKNYFQRALWQRNQLGNRLKEEKCDLLFVPGGSFATDFRPVVTMSRNMLPFEWQELLRYGVTLLTIKLVLLRWVQSKSLKKADGIIFLTQYAHDAVLNATGRLNGMINIIPHGIDQRFFYQQRLFRSSAEISEERPFRLIYVSIIDAYKHQWHVAEAVAKLRDEGIDIALDLVGPSRASSFRRLQHTLNRIDSVGGFIRYLGAVPYKKLHTYYEEADLCLFASSCENMPNILLEGMASGLPVACSDRGPMPEILGNAGTYFNPEDVTEIANAIRVLLNSRELRERQAHKAYERAQHFSWERCAHETFGFILNVAANHSVAVNTRN